MIAGRGIAALCWREVYPRWKAAIEARWKQAMELRALLQEIEQDRPTTKAHSNRRLAATHLQRNRHRGTGHPASPATPPYMRVRIRRFGGLSWASTDHGWKPELGEVGIGQGNVQSR